MPKPKSKYLGLRLNLDPHFPTTTTDQGEASCPGSAGRRRAPRSR